MKAVYYEKFGSADVLQIGELPKPKLAADEVLVQVGAAGVNPIDRRLRNGELQDFFKREWPIIPGWDVAGRIVEVGEDVTSWQPGDDIIGLAFTWFLHHGTYAEYVPVKVASIAPKPERFSFAETAALPLVSLTAWESLAEYAKLQAGQSVLIQAGAGGLGSVAISIAKYFGATVYTTARKANHDYVHSRGADHIIDYTQIDYVGYIKQHEPEGLDVVLETLGTNPDIINAIHLVKPGGTVAYMNNEPPDMPEIKQNNIETKFLHHRPDGESLRALMELYKTDKLALPEINVMDLDDAADAHRMSESRQTRGKIVLKVQDI
jgi:NADPH:quinone reductase-like Zn-dependent oxidoreductase